MLTNIDNIKLLIWKLRSFFLKINFRLNNTSSFLGKNIQIIGANKFQLKKNCTLGDNFWLNINNNGASDKEICVTIGSFSNIGRHNFFTVGDSLSIGEYFFSSCYCSIIGASHENSDPYKPYIISDIIDLGHGVEIGTNVFMGAHSMITGSVKVGFGSIIAAGAVVVKDIPPLSIVVGSPGKVVKRFSLSKNSWIDVDKYNPEELITEDRYKDMIAKKNPHVTKACHAASIKSGWT